MRSKADLRGGTPLVSFNHVIDPHFVAFSSSLYTTICNHNPNPSPNCNPTLVTDPQIGPKDPQIVIFPIFPAPHFVSCRIFVDCVCLVFGAFSENRPAAPDVQGLLTFIFSIIVSSRSNCYYISRVDDIPFIIESPRFVLWRAIDRLQLWVFLRGLRTVGIVRSLRCRHAGRRNVQSAPCVCVDDETDLCNSLLIQHDCTRCLSSFSLVGAG